MKLRVFWSVSDSIAPVQIAANDVQEPTAGGRAMTVSEKTRVVLGDLKTRESRRRLRNWRRMVERYAENGVISRRSVRCLKCGRVVDMVCEECLECAAEL